ncbi:MAG: RsmD family RNA methyltransferase [Chitinispirillaceae bacterium]
MRLRIISGELKGRYLSVSGSSRFRPTLERTRESVAEILKKRLRGSYVADLCAGSGAFGFEMLSRGALRADFVEQNKKLASEIRKNAERLHVQDRIRVFTDDVRTFLRMRKHQYDVVFYDPPYDRADLQEIIPSILDLLVPKGILVYERRRLPKEKKPPEFGEKELLSDARLFGDTVVEFYTLQNKEM